MTITDPVVLTERGYRRTSRKHGMVSRIDREDWIDILAEHLILPRAELMKRIRGFPGMWQDYYRRVLSKDKVTLNPPQLALHIPTSDRDPIGWVP